LNNIRHYEIKLKLGSGGMGSVFKAFDTQLERYVAIKLMHPHLLDDETSTKRFSQEAKAAAKLIHPNIVTIHEIGDSESGPYIVMEYIKGMPLNKLLYDTGPLSWKRAVKYVIQVLRGIHSAHTLGIIHRDIKADNIIITDSDNIKILDFGIAKITSLAGQTKKEDILGTTEYMAPEQILGEEIDVRCDVYATGLVLYQMLTGRIPFTGESTVAVLYNKLNEKAIHPSHYNENISSALDQIVLKSLASKKEDRWGSAETFAKALENFLEALRKDKTDQISSDFPDLDYLQDKLEESDDGGEFKSVFIGRHKEFRTLSKFFEQVKRGNGKTVILMGETGVGKTALANRFQKFVEDCDAWILYGACLYKEGMAAYLPYIDALRSFFRNSELQLPVEKREKIKQLINERIPLLREFSERFTTNIGSLKPANEENLKDSKTNLLEGITFLISFLASIKPVFIIIDDLQWGDEESIQLFHYLARHSMDSRILQIGISRTDQYDLQRKGKPIYLVDVFSRMKKDGVAEELELSRLTREETDQLVNKTLGKTLLSDQFYQKIFSVTSGIPFFVLETLHLLKNKGTIYIEEDVWYDSLDWQKVEVPRRVEDVFKRRLSALKEKERELLQISSIIGSKFDIAILSKIAEISKINVLKILQKIEQELQIVINTADNFQFEHPLLKEMLYQEVPNVLRREYHLMIAAELKKRYKGEYGAFIGDAANHFKKGEDFKSAVPLLHQAGTRSFKLAAYKEASIFFEDTLDAEQKVKTTILKPEDYKDIYLKIAICYEENGQWEKSIDFYLKLLEHSEKDHDINGQVDALRRLGRIFIKKGDLDQALVNYENCCEILSKHPIPNTVSRIYNNMGIIYYQRGDYQEALEHFDKTLKSAEGENGEYDKAHAYTNRGIIYNIQGLYEEALRNYLKALQIYKNKKDKRSEAQVYHNMGMTYSDLGRLDDAEEHFIKTFDLADELEDKRLIGLTNINVSKIYLKQNKLKKTRNHLEKSLNFFKRVSDALSIAEIYHLYGTLYMKEGNDEKAEKFFLESIRLNNEHNYFEGMAEVCESYADFLCQKNQEEEAVDFYQQAIDDWGEVNMADKINSIRKKLNDIKVRVKPDYSKTNIVTK
jgi:serine/threonine protein kinase/tetratricopeptide (TPR) repeat protein